MSATAETPRDYVLTDGIEEYGVRSMTEDEARAANEEAEQFTGGNVWWGVKGESDEAPAGTGHGSLCGCVECFAAEPEDDGPDWLYDDEAQAAQVDAEDDRCPGCGERHPAHLDCDGVPHDPGDVCPTCGDPDCFRPAGHPLDEHDA